MSDDGEMWAAIKEEGRKKRWSNFEQSIALLERKGIPVRILNRDVAHCRVGEWDFWPTTGKFRNPKTGESGRGVFNLIKQLEK